MKYVHELGELFEAVQMASVFPDGKTFPDCLPKKTLSSIAKQYEKNKSNPDFDLKKFVHDNFDMPPVVGSDFQSDPSRSPEQHVEALWDVLTRKPDAKPPKQSSLLPLPNPYVVPGGRFREVYYWDSYFTMLGLKASGRWELIGGMLNNFSYLAENYGLIPNGNRSYYLGRSQPPFASLMVKLYAEHVGEEALVKYFPLLTREYKFWQEGMQYLSSEQRANEHVVALGGADYLARYWDEYDTPRPESFREDVELALTSMQPTPQVYRNLRAAAESGWDFSSRWFADKSGFASICTTDIIPVDLNCLIWHLESTLSEICGIIGQADLQQKIGDDAEDRKRALLRHCWDETDGFFFDYNYKKGRITNHRTLAAMFPLFFKLATQEQANQVADIIENDFLKPGGLVTTLLETGQQWDAPNGWAPLQWIGYIGLKNYGHDRLAERVKTNWTNAVREVYCKTGKMTEKYNVLQEGFNAGGGEYPNQDGFGWTNGVFLAMVNDR